MIIVEPQATGTSAFHFLTLPAEIRNMIYMQIFGGLPEKVQVYATQRKRHVRSWTGPKGKPSKVHELNILATCRSIHHEAASMFYESVQFELESSSLHSFLSALPVHLEYIHKVTMDMGGTEGARRALRLLSKVKHLELLHVVFHRHNRPTHVNAEHLSDILCQLLEDLQEKINDREAVCRKITFDCRARWWDPTSVDLITRDEFKRVVFTYLHDVPEADRSQIHASPTVVDEHPARRETGRPKRAAVTKIISHTEYDWSSRFSQVDNPRRGQAVHDARST